MLSLVFSHIFCIFAVFVTVLSFKTFVHSNHIVLYALATFSSLCELILCAWACRGGDGPLPPLYLPLLAYACKTGSSTVIKLAPRMHQNLSFWAKNEKKLWGGAVPSKTPHTVGRGFLSFPHIHPLGASFLALAMIRPSHLLNCGYAHGAFWFSLGHCCVALVALGLVSWVSSQEERLWNDPFCVKWIENLISTNQSSSSQLTTVLAWFCSNWF